MKFADDLEIAVLLEQFNQGHAPASERLLALLYSQLHRLAEGFMRHQPLGHTLQATALVNEAYLRISQAQPGEMTDRQTFLSAAATAMRRVLTDHARSRRSRPLKPGEYSALDSVVLTYEDRAFDLLALDLALEKLALRDPMMAKAVELRFFAGLTMDEVAHVLAVPKRNLERDWTWARVWLYEEMS